MLESRSGTFIDTTVLVIGSGIAGLLTAIELFDLGMSVVLACKGSLTQSNTNWAQGGLAGVTAPSCTDSIDQHLADTIKSGAGLVDPTVARTVIGGAAALIARLAQLGVAFDRTGDGGFDLAREGGHSSARVHHTKDATGRSIVEALVSQLKRRQQDDQKRLRVIENAFALQLLKSNQRVCGCRFAFAGGTLVVSSPYTVLATGGVGQLFLRTTNPAGATGDGIAIAYRAGAALVDLEFTQFHPTALCLPGAPSYLVSEAARGAGAVLKDKYSQPFMHRFHPDGDLATRDIVARAIQSTMLEQKADCVFLDMTTLKSAELWKRFPNILKSLATFGIDATTQPVPVCPAAHYFMGGILADMHGRSTLPGLFAIGECASNGLHGANRLASNSLLEGGVMAMKVSRAILGDHCSDFAGKKIGIASAPHLVPTDMECFRRAMYENAGLLRDRYCLNNLLKNSTDNSFVSSSQDADSWSKANMLLVGSRMAAAALKREESRGSHCRSDYPERNDITFANRLAVCGEKWEWLETGPFELPTDRALFPIALLSSPKVGKVQASAR